MCGEERHSDTNVPKHACKCFTVHLSTLHRVMTTGPRRKIVKFANSPGQREKPPLKNPGKSLKNRKQKGQIHNKHVLPTIQFSCGLSELSLCRNQITVGTRGEAAVLQNSSRHFLFNYFSGAVKNKSCCRVVLQKHPRGMCSIEQLLSSDQERRFQWFGMNSHHITTRHKEMSGTGGGKDPNGGRRFHGESR